MPCKLSDQSSLTFQTSSKLLELFMIKNIIFLIESPFNKRDYKRFGSETLIKSGFDVEFWDFTPFINPIVFEKYIPPDSFTFDGLKLFYSKNSAIEAIEKLSYQKTLIVTFLSFQIGTLEIYKALSSRNLVYGSIACGALPSAFGLENKEKKLNYLISGLVLKLFRDPSSLTRSIFSRLSPKLFGVKPMNFLILGGEKSVKRRPIAKNTNLIHGCTFDYDLYLQNERGDSNSDSQYKGNIVFLDEYLPFHPDFLQMGVATPCDPEQYYPKLVDFFQKLEHVLDSRVVIAAHPRSHYESHPDYFDGRDVVRGATQSLVKNSKCVITHGSTSVSFAVIYRKPILFATLNCIKNYSQYPLSQTYNAIAHSLGKGQISLDSSENIDWQAELEVNQQAYKLYLDSYIKSPLAPEKTCWEIFAEYVKTI
jgi:hypothetical protein